MNSSEQIDKLATALSKAQATIGGAVKDAENPFFKSKYADLGAVVKAIKDSAAENNLSYVQFPAADDNRIGITTRLMHSSGQWLEQEFTIPINKMDAQAAGSVLTYFRRYSLAAVFGVPQVDDDAEAGMVQARKTLEQWIAELKPSIEAIQAGIESGDLASASEAWFELSDDEKAAIFVAPSKGGPFTTHEREVMKSTEFREAHYGVTAA